MYAFLIAPEKFAEAMAAEEAAEAAVLDSSAMRLASAFPLAVRLFQIPAELLSAEQPQTEPAVL